MIKDVSHQFQDHEHYQIICDSCHVVIAECWNFEFEGGQKLVYAPILCEKCGTERSKDHGEKTQLLQDIDKLIHKMDVSIERVQKVLDEKKELFK